MKRFDSSKLLEDLMADTRQLILTAGKFEHLDRKSLETQPQPGSWSIAQILEHLNFYSAFYLSAIDEKLRHSQTRPRETFKSGWFGNYFTKMMKPSADNQVKTKMKAMKSATPPAETDGSAALAQFVADQHRLLDLLHMAHGADLGRVRVPTSISRLIALKLGDTFRFLIAHEQRHFVQIQAILQEMGKQQPHYSQV